MDERWFQLFGDPAAGIHDPFCLSMYAERINVVESTIYGKLLVDGHFTTAVDFFNCYILCASEYEDVADIDNLFEDAPDYWYLPESNALHFCLTLAEAIKKKVRYNLIENPEFWPIRMVPKDAQLTVAYRFKRVAYGDREVVVTRQSDVDRTTLLKKYRECPFIKPMRYINEKEFRFSFVVFANGRPVPVIDEAIYIDIKDIPQYVRGK